MALIFAFSQDSESGSHSGWVVRILREAWLGLTGTTPEPAVLATLHLGLRKLAHMTEFGILYLLLRRAGPGRPQAFLLTVLYAASDELHQAFVPTRVAGPVDVLVDSAGACLALAWEGRRAERRTMKTFAGGNFPTRQGTAGPGSTTPVGPPGRTGHPAGCPEANRLDLPDSGG